MKSLAVIGAGNLGISIIEGILKNNYIPANQIFATRNKLERLAFLKDKNVNIGNDNELAVKNAEIIILALKPFKIIEILHEIKPFLDPKKHILISVATGISIQEMQAAIGAEMPIYRAMPNTAIAAEESMTCICGQNGSEKNNKLIEEIFNHVGESLFINEELMNAATVLGASGIAFVFRFIRGMIQGGIEIGFDSKTAAKIVVQTVKGAAELLEQNGLHPEEEIDKVTTPKGCTITGLNEMEHQGLSSALIKGIVASHQKIISK